MKSAEAITDSVLKEQLLKAVQDNDIDKLTLLLNQTSTEIINTDDLIDTLLGFAIKQNSTKQIFKTIQLLLKNGADPSKINGHRFDFRFIAILEQLSPDEILTLFNSTKFKKELLYSSILKVSQYGTPKTLQTLLDLLPQLNQEDQDINKIIDSQTGDNLLFLAVKKGRPEIIPILIKCSADPTRRINGLILNTFCLVFKDLAQNILRLMEITKNGDINITEAGEVFLSDSITDNEYIKSSIETTETLLKVLEILLPYLPKNLDKYTFAFGIRYAVIIKDIKLAKEFIERTDEQIRKKEFKSFDFNHFNFWIEYSSYHLFETNHLESPFIKLLLQAGAYVCDYKASALLNDLKNPDSIFSVIKNQNDFELTEEEFLQILKFLYEKGIFLNIETFLEYGREKNILAKAINKLFEKWVFIDFLGLDGKSNKRKIENQASCETLLLYLSKANDYENVKFVLERSADIIIDLNSASTNKKYAIHFAIEHNNFLLIKLLLENGANPNLENVLELACDAPDPNILLYILKHKDLKIQSKEQYFKIGARIFAIEPSEEPAIYEDSNDQFFDALKYLYLAADHPDAEKLRDYCILALLGKNLFKNTLFSIQDYEVVRIKNNDDYKEFFQSRHGKELIKYFHSIGDNGSACYTLGDIYSSLDQDEKAVQYFDKSKMSHGILRAGTILLSMGKIEDAYERILGIAIDSQNMQVKYQPAFDYLVQQIANPNKINYAKAQLALGMFYFNQVNMQGNLKQVDNAIHWLTLAANEGESEVKFYLGQAYRAKQSEEMGNLREKSLDLIIESAQLGFKEAIEQLEHEDSPKAILELVTIYYKDKNFKKSTELLEILIQQKNFQAFSLLKKIANSQDVKCHRAQLLLAKVYEEGKFFYDPEKAVYYYQLASLNGNAEALYYLESLAKEDPKNCPELEAMKIVNSRIALAEYYLQKKQYTKVIPFLNFADYNFYKSQRTFKKALIISHLIDNPTCLETICHSPELKSYLCDVSRHFFQRAFTHEGRTTIPAELPELHYLKALALNKNITAQYLLGCYYLSKGMNELSTFHFEQAKKNGHPLAMHATSNKQLLESWQKNWNRHSHYSYSYFKFLDIFESFQNKVSSHLSELIHSFRSYSFRDYSFRYAFLSKAENITTCLEEGALKLFEDPDSTYSYNHYDSDSKFTTLFESILYNDAKKFHELFGLIHFIIQQICREAALRPKLVEDESEDENRSDQESKSFG